MPAGDYYLGALFLAVTYGAVFAATEIAVRRRLPSYTGVLRAVAWAVLATAGLLATHLLPAALTILERETAALTALLLVAAVALWVPTTAEGPPGPPTSHRGERVERLIAAVGLVGAGIWLLAALLKYIDTPPIGFDVASAYLPTAARWLQEGSIWEIADWVPNAFYGSGPGNGSVVVLSAMLPWDNDFLAHLAMYPFIGLLVAALYALARELGAAAPLALLAALMVTAAPVVVQPGLVDGLLDPVMYSTLAAGMLFLVRHARSGARSELLLAGVALGICFGTKFYGYTGVAVVLAVWVGARLIARVPPATVVRQATAVGALVLAGGGIWMLRNLFETGNPVLPLKVDAFGVTIFDAPEDPQRELLGDTLASYLDQPSVWLDTLAHQFRIAAGVPLILLALGVLAAAFLLWRHWRCGPWGKAERLATGSLAAAILLAAVYAITPYSAPGVGGEPNAAAINVRYGVPAMVAAVAVLGWAAAQLPPRVRAVAAVAALVATIDALRVGTVTKSSVVYVSFALAVAAVGGYVLVRNVMSSGRFPRSGRPVAIGAGLAAVLALVLAGERVQERFNDDRYATVDPALAPVVTGDGEIRVGLSGHWSLRGVVPTYPSFGKRLQNRVDYLGSVEDGLLTAFSTEQDFQAAVRDAEPDVLVLGRDVQTVFPPGQPPPSPEELRDWAEAVGYEEVGSSERFLIMAPAPGA